MKKAKRDKKKLKAENKKKDDLYKAIKKDRDNNVSFMCSKKSLFRFFMAKGD